MAGRSGDKSAVVCGGAADHRAAAAFWVVMPVMTGAADGAERSNPPHSAWRASAAVVLALMPARVVRIRRRPSGSRSR